MTSTVEAIETILEVKGAPSLYEEELFLKSKKFSRMISWIPGIQMIAISNSLAMYATHKDSDIDIFIITKSHRMWLVRTLVLLVATIFKVRAKPDDEAGKFCFPFFMTDKNLSLRNIALENDIYLAYWIQTLFPLLSKNHTYGRFINMNEAFCKENLDTLPKKKNEFSHLEKNEVFHKRIRGNKFLQLTQKYNPLPYTLNILDSLLEIVSMNKIQKRIPSENTEGIRITENMIKLHSTDRRKEIRDKVQKTI